jgi:hypothetical protein
MGAAAAHKQPRGALAWLAFMVASWLVFAAVALTTGAALTDAWDAVRDLPVVLEVVVWFLALPWMVALAVWESGWSEAARVAGVSCVAVAWTLMSIPRANP